MSDTVCSVSIVTVFERKISGPMCFPLGRSSVQTRYRAHNGVAARLRHSILSGFRRDRVRLSTDADRERGASQGRSPQMTTSNSE